MIILTDIHGNFKTLQALLAKIPQEELDKGIVIAGDLIDRGPRSKQVVQWAIDNNIQCVTGNHEQMMVDWVANGCSYKDELWLLNGGNQALNSYREEDPNHYLKGEVDFEKVKEHALWMDKLPIYLEFPDIKNDDGRYLVVSHSVITNNWKDRNSTDPSRIHWFQNNVTWGRPVKVRDVPEIYNVIGHTPQENGPRIRSNYANIDTGCFYMRPGYGRLTALSFPSMQIWEQENVDFKTKV